MKLRNRLWITFLLPLFLLVFGVSAISQEPPTVRKQVKKTEDQEQKGPAVFTSKVDQVVLYAAVYDQAGELVSSLEKEDFAVFEDRVEQEITSFGLEDVPSTIGIVMDKSGSMRGKWEMVSRATQLFLSMSNPENEMFLIAFDDEVDLAEPLTRDVADINDTLYNIAVSGGTALYDAIYLAVDQARDGDEIKKAIVVFTDGEDKDSYYTHQEVLDKVQESEVQIYIVAFLDEDVDDQSGFFGVFKSERDKITKGINEIAEETGGKAFFPEEIRELDGVFRTIATALRNQYRLAYVSNNPERDGKFRRIRVQIADAKPQGLRIRAKRGYFAR